MASPRLWNVVLHQHEDESFTARVSVDGKLLRPDCGARSATATLAYIEEALVDARAEDQFVLRAQGGTGIRTCTARDAAMALHWLTEQTPERSRSGTLIIPSEMALGQSETKVC